MARKSRTRRRTTCPPLGRRAGLDDDAWPLVRITVWVDDSVFTHQPVRRLGHVNCANFRPQGAASSALSYRQQIKRVAQSQRQPIE